MLAGGECGIGIRTGWLVVMVIIIIILVVV